MFNAKMDLFNYGSTTIDMNLLAYGETFGEYTYNDDFTGSDGNVPVTFDGVTLTDSNLTMFSVIQGYFYNYVNVSPEYYNLEDYIKNHTKQAIWDVVDCVEGGSGGYMANALGLLEYLYNNAENLSHGDLLVGDECTISGEGILKNGIYYQLPLLVNDKYLGIDAVYDKDGNLMEIWSTEEVDNDQLLVELCRRNQGTYSKRAVCFLTVPYKITVGGRRYVL